MSRPASRGAPPFALWILGAVWVVSAMQCLIADAPRWPSAAALILVTLLVGGLAETARRGRKEGLGLLASLGQLPDWVVRSTQLTSVALLGAAIVVGNPGLGRPEFQEPCMTVGIGLAMVSCLGKPKPIWRGWRSSRHGRSSGPECI